MQTIFPGRVAPKNEFMSIGHSVEVVQLPRDFVPRQHEATRGRERAHQLSPVFLGDDAGIGDDDRSAVGGGADQSAESLFETKRGVWHHVLSERISAALDNRLAVRCRHGLGWNAKRESSDQQSPKRIARYIHPFPIRRSAEQYGAPGLSESVEQRVPALLAMNEQRPIVAKASAAEHKRDFLHVPMTREQS